MLYTLPVPPPEYIIDPAPTVTDREWSDLVLRQTFEEVFGLAPERKESPSKPGVAQP